MAKTNLDALLKTGSLLVIQGGAYSDKFTEDPVRVLKDVTLRTLVNEFETAWRSNVEVRKRGNPWFDEDEDRNGPGEPRRDSFLPWLVLSGYVESVDLVFQWHIGSGSDFEPRE